MLVDQGLDIGRQQMALAGDASHLVGRRFRANVRIEATGRGVHQIGRNRRDIVTVNGFYGLNSSLDCITQGRIEWPLV